MELSIRLKTVAEAVTKGNRVADVGTDHGYVPIYLVKNNLSPAGIAMDVNKGPLEKAQEHIREEKIGGKIATRLGNGLAPLEPGETDTVIIAGMGGDLICKILKARIFNRGKRVYFAATIRMVQDPPALKRISLSD